MRSVLRSKAVMILSVLVFAFAATDAPALTQLSAVEVSGGENHTLVLSADGRVLACGLNRHPASEYFGVLGTGDRGRDEEWRLVHVHGPNDVTFLDNISEISAGWMHSAALDEEGCVWTWGEGSYGRLGNGVNYREPYPDDPIYGDGETTPVRVLSGQQDPNDPNSLLRYIIDISAGRSGEYCLAVDANNVCYAFGRNNKGQLGNGSTTKSNVPVEVNDTYDIGRLENVIAVSAGEEQSMALDANGFVWTWGDGAYGKLGNGADDDERSPVKVRGVNDVNFLENIVAISAGWDHCMAREGFDPCDPNICGRVFCWGNNDMGYYSGQGGRLGNGENTGSKSTPVIVKAGQQDPNAQYLKNVVAISAGESHSMALADGHVFIWGDNDFGQLGTGNYNDYNTPVKVVAPDRDGDGYSDDLDGNSVTVDYLGDDVPIVKISAGYWHSLAIDEQGRLYSWGMFDNGRLGLGDTYDRNVPTLVDLIVPPVRNLTQNLEYFEIQPAIDDTKAEPNDVIEADPCTYNENISFGTKALTVRSINPQDWSVVAVTIIQGAGITVTFGSQSVAVISGFTVTGSSDGFYCHSSQGTIDHCIIEDNGGDGIDSFLSSMTISNNIIRNNGQLGVSVAYNASGVAPQIMDNWIYNNGASSSHHGIQLSNITPQAVIRNNTIVNNEGCGIKRASGTSPAISNCIIWDNDVTPFDGISTVTVLSKKYNAKQRALATYKTACEFC